MVLAQAPDQRPASWFDWHPLAEVFDAAGQSVSRGAAFHAEIADRPSALALATALSGQGRAFRIGGQGAVAAAHGDFETLTGGSLGSFRRVRRTQGSWLASFAINARLFDLQPGAQVAILGRLSHSLALYGALEGVCLGASVHLLDDLRPDHQLRALAARGITHLYATPAQLRMVAGAAGPICPDLRQVIVGGSKLDAPLRQAVSAMAPKAALHEFYGAAEASFINLSGPKDAPHTVGHPYPGVAIRLLSSEGAEVPMGQAGEVWVKSPYLFKGYAGDDPGSARWREGWLSVGEVGTQTPEGLVLHGRAGRMVTIADRNVFPEEIETYLAALPGVQAVAVLPVTDAARGAVLVACLQGDPGCEGAILRATRASLGPLIAPKRLIWVQDWPRLPSGKTDLAALRERVGPWR